MRKFIYSLRDLKTGFCDPTLELSDEIALRNFQYALKNQPGIIGFAPQDFQLYCIGEFDTQSGILYTFDVPRLVVSVSDLSFKE